MRMIILAATAALLVGCGGGKQSEATDATARAALAKAEALSKRVDELEVRLSVMEGRPVTAEPQAWQ